MNTLYLSKVDGAMSMSSMKMVPPCTFVMNVGSRSITSILTLDLAELEKEAANNTQWCSIDSFVYVDPFLYYKLINRLHADKPDIDFPQADVWLQQYEERGMPFTAP